MHAFPREFAPSSHVEFAALGAKGAHMTVDARRTLFAITYPTKVPLVSANTGDHDNRHCNQMGALTVQHHTARDIPGFGTEGTQLIVAQNITVLIFTFRVFTPLCEMVLNTMLRSPCNRVS